MDVSKGIAILLVIVAHTVDVGLAKWIIYSFHMPLFFLLSGTVSMPSRDLDRWGRRVKKLLHPLVTYSFGGYTLLLLLLLLLFRQPIAVTCFRDYLHNLLYFDDADVGYLWFLLAMYFARITYDLLHLTFSSKKTLYRFLLCLLSIAGAYIGIRHPLPFGLDISLAVLIFFELGKHIREEPLHSPKRMALFLLIWLGSLAVIFHLTGNQWGETPNFLYLSLARRSYPFYPLCFLCAFAGTWTVCGISVQLRRIPRLFSSLAFVGKHSLTLLMVHYFDRLWEAPWIYLKEHAIGTQATVCLTRVAIDLLIFCLIVLIKGQIKKEALQAVTN